MIRNKVQVLDNFLILVQIAFTSMNVNDNKITNTYNIFVIIPNSLQCSNSLILLNRLQLYTFTNITYSMFSKGFSIIRFGVNKAIFLPLFTGSNYTSMDHSVSYEIRHVPAVQSRAYIKPL